MKNPNPLANVLNFSVERYLRTASDIFIYDGDYETSLSLVEKTLEIDGDDLRALVLRADILFCLNRDAEALQSLNHALQVNVACAEAHLSKAGVLEALGKTREALVCCNKAWSLLDVHNAYLLPTVLDQKLVLLLGLKKYREAHRLLEDARHRLSEEDYQSLWAVYRGQIQQHSRQRGRRHQAPVRTLKVLSS